MKKLTPAKVISLIIGGLFVIAFIIISVKVFVDRPQDLGPELEYIGKEHTGCPLPLPLGYIMLCSSEPGEEYYFATNLSMDELKKRFNATSAPNDNLPDGTGAATSGPGEYLEYTFEFLSFKSLEGKRFTITYYNNKKAILLLGGLSNSSKASIISLDKESYQVAKELVLE